MNEQSDVIQVYSRLNSKPVPNNIVQFRKKTGWLLKIRNVLQFIGPAFIVSVAYIDPGNFATNISGGSRFNYNLVWVILWSNLMAIFLQSMSARLGYRR